MTADEAWPPGSGEMAGRIRTHDWAGTSLGPIEGWSPRLRTLVEHAGSVEGIFGPPWRRPGTSSRSTREEADSALRESEARQAFLLGLSDALRPLIDLIAIQETASRMTAEHLDVDRVTYCEVRHEPEVTVIVGRDRPRRGMPSVVAGRHRMDDFGPFQTEGLTAGRPAIVANATTDPRRSSARAGAPSTSSRPAGFRC